MRAMLREHLDTTAQEVSAGLKKDWGSDIKAYDKLHWQILKMADVLSSGVVRGCFQISLRNKPSMKRKKFGSDEKGGSHNLRAPASD